MDLRLPIDLNNNLDIIIKYQNINLVKDICKYMGWNKSIEDKYATPGVKVYNNREVTVLFATANQVGLNYLAPADSGGVISFKGAERDSDGMGDGLDNLGAMTTRRTYVNFVPRDFAELTELPSS